MRSRQKRMTVKKQLVKRWRTSGRLSKSGLIMILHICWRTVSRIGITLNKVIV